MSRKREMSSLSESEDDLHASTKVNPSDSDKDITPVQRPPKAAESSPMKKVIVRSITASVLAVLYLILLQTGHLYCIFSVILTQTQLYREIVNVRYVAAKERAMPWFRSFQWSWFFAAMIFVYGETFERFCEDRKSLSHLYPMIRDYLNYIVYGMYWAIFVGSVLTLKPGLIRFQLSQHMWSIVTVCLVVFQAKFFATNTLNGLFWFFFPMATVFMNDVSAYFSGITFGKKFIKAKFLSLSPNKTWEGFIGALILTLVFSFFFPALLAQFSWFTCPAEELYLIPFPKPLTCEPNSVFIPTTYNLPLVGEQVLYPMQFHGLVYGLFASVVAPFGGFFASAIKRAYHKKDFDSFMPGHGGMMDRMDCQLLMSTFSAFYYFSFIAHKAKTVNKMILEAAIMSPENQLLLWEELGKMVNATNCIEVAKECVANLG